MQATSPHLVSYDSDFAEVVRDCPFITSELLAFLHEPRRTEEQQAESFYAWRRWSRGCGRCAIWCRFRCALSFHNTTGCLFGLVHLEASLAALVLGGRRRGDDGCVHHGAFAHLDSALAQHECDFFNDDFAEVVPVEQCRKLSTVVGEVDAGEVAHRLAALRLDHHSCPLFPYFTGIGDFFSLSLGIALRAHETGMEGVLTSEDEPKTHLPLALTCLRNGGVYLTAELLRPLAAGKKPDVLYPRELEAVKLLGAGLGRKAICDKLGISVRTVDALFDSAFRKLEISGRQALREWSVQRFR